MILTNLQKNVLRTFLPEGDATHANTIARIWNLEHVLAKNVLLQLAGFKLLTQEQEFIFSLSPAGWAELRSIGAAAFNPAPEDIAVSTMEAVIISILEEKKPHQKPTLYVARRLNLEREKATLAAFMKGMAAEGKICFHENNSTFTALKKAQKKQTSEAAEPVTAKEKGVAEKAHKDSLEQDMPDTPIVLDNKALPPELEVSLQSLQAKITYPPKILIQQLDLKLRVLDRLSALMDDSIAEVLKEISLDLTDITNFGAKP